MTRTAGSLVRDFFVAPAGERPVERGASVPPVVVVLGDARRVAAAACAAALDLARRGGHDHAAVCLWAAHPAPAPRVPATPAARRGAERAAARGCETDATGRLVRAWLPSEAAGAAATAQRVLGGAQCPGAVALAGPRGEELDTLFALADAVLLVRRPGEAPSLTRLARAGLAHLQVPVVTWETHLGAATRLLATTGLAVTSSARGALAPLPLAA